MAANTDSSNGLGKTLTGCVKWFNNGLNYGFITVLTEGEHRNTDVFVHQSNIKTSRDCFRTLYTGECVQFELTKSDNEKHPIHAVAVQGFNGVQLRCEVPRNRPGTFRGRGNGRGRGGFRGTSGFRSTSRPEGDATGTQAAEPTTAPAAETAQSTVNDEAVKVQDAPVAESAAPVAKGRGRGRGRKVAA